MFDKKRRYATVASIIFMFALWGLVKYPGQASIYILFTIISNALFYMGIRKNAIFFDTFIGLFFWLGFWLKFTFRLIFTERQFVEPTGNFGSIGVAAYDYALLVASCGLFGLLLASLIRQYFCWNYPRTITQVAQSNLFAFYKKYKNYIVVFFTIVIFSIAISNIILGIYQRGTVTQTFLPFGLNGIYKWLLLFGLASFSALILRFELEINKKPSFLAMCLALLEGFVSSVSLLSRGMILNASALLYGSFISFKIYSIKSSLKFWLSVLAIFGILFASSVISVNYLRAHSYIFNDIASATTASTAVTPSTHFNSATSSRNTDTISDAARSTNLINLDVLYVAATYIPPLLTDRWVGMEGVMAVSSYPHLGWDLWKTAWEEVYNESKTSFYDLNIIKTPYANANNNKHHFISLPGIIAFFFYPGSFLFLFASMFALGSFAAVIEFLVYRLGGKNIILCALMAQVIAYRFASFGYVPTQSYLLIGSLLLNVLLIYSLDKVMSHIKKKEK